MTKVKVAGFGVSLDGFGAGIAQSLENPLGKHGEEIFQWFFPTSFFRQMTGKEGGDTGLDDQFGRRAMAGFGAFILGRNMFGPIRGEWRKRVPRSDRRIWQSGRLQRQAGPGMRSSRG